MQTTIWSNIYIEHPDDWELALVSPPGAKGRLSFVDRYVQRLDVHWRPVSRPIDPQVVLSRHRPGKGSSGQARDLSGCPRDWGGIVVTSPDGVKVHAVRTFAEFRLLVEVAILWPSEPPRARSRDRKIERSVLEGVSALNPHRSPKQWRALGLSAEVPGDYEMDYSTANPGRISWEFITKRKDGPDILIERIAMPELVKTRGLEEWVTSQLPSRSRVQRSGEIEWNDHNGQEIYSRQVNPVPLFRLVRPPMKRRDIVWICETENRLYRMQVGRVDRSDDLPVPPKLHVHCCQDVPEVEA